MKEINFNRMRCEHKDFLMILYADLQTTTRQDLPITVQGWKADGTKQHYRVDIKYGLEKKTNEIKYYVVFSWTGEGQERPGGRTSKLDDLEEAKDVFYKKCREKFGSRYNPVPR